MGWIQLQTRAFTVEVITYEPGTVAGGLPTTVSGIHTFQITLK